MSSDDSAPTSTAPTSAFGPGSVTVPPPGDPATFPALQAEIRQLARDHNAVILAHSYERPEIQDVADHVGDSLRLSRVAASAPESTIVFCGVSFMAETAKILSPDKRVLLPDKKAGCSLADSITVEQLRAWKAEHHGAVVVSYVNTTAAVKAESDYCCTSSNARAVINAIPADRQILFLPDMFLGLWLQRVTGRKLTIWLGECHVHAGIRPADVEQWHRDLPGAELLIHPECGCTSQVLEAAGDDVHILSTEGMVTYAQAVEGRHLPDRDRDGHPAPARAEGARQAVRPGQSRGGLPVHEADDAREGPRLAPPGRIRDRRTGRHRGPSPPRPGAHDRDLLERVADFDLDGWERLALIQSGEDVALRSVVVHESVVFVRDPGVVRVAGLPGPSEDHAAQSDLHQLFEAVEAGLEGCVKDRPVDSDAESRGRGHGVLLGVDTQADVVQLARQASIGLLSAKRTAAAAALSDGAVGIAGRRSVVAAAQNSVVAHDHRANV